MKKVLLSSIVLTIVGSYSIASGPIDAAFWVALTVLYGLALMGSVACWLAWRVSHPIEPRVVRFASRGGAVVGLGLMWVAGVVTFVSLPALALLVMFTVGLVAVPVLMAAGWLVGRVIAHPRRRGAKATA